MSFDVLTGKEELGLRKRMFNELKEGKLFNLSLRRYFVAVKRNSKNSWKVIEFTPANIQKIIKGERCETSILTFNEMKCLNLQDN